MKYPKRCLKGESHHWMLPPPSGPNQEGTCKKCGKTYNEFQNSTEYTYWRNFKETATKKKKTRRPVSAWDKKQMNSKSKKDNMKLS